MLTILVNSRYKFRRRTGVERYSAEIVQRLDGQVRQIAPQRGIQGWQGHLWEQLILPSKVQANELLWSIANTGPIALERQVLSLHDVSFLDHPEWYARAFSLWYRLLLPHLVRRVRAVFTVSSYVKIRILRAGWIAEQRVKIIPGGVTLGCFYPRRKDEIEHIRQKFRLPERYFLTVGSLQPRKNLWRLADAFQQNYGHKGATALVLAGESRSNFRHISLPQSSANIRLCGYVADDDLPRLYSGALALVIPSLEEGFGLPALEAMACGTPVIAARSGALPEIYARAAFLVDPTSVDEIAGALKEIEGKPDLRKELAGRGFELAHEYTWDRSAQAAWQALQDVQSEGRVL